MSPRNVLRSLDTVIKRTTVKGPKGKDVPLKHATLHDLRRSFGTHFADVEPRMHIVSDVMGHKKLETTKKFYVHTKERTMTESVIKLTLGTPRQNPSVPRSVPQNKKTAKTA